MSESSNTKYTKSYAATEVIMILLSLVILSPILYQLISSFKTREEINRPLSLPSGLNLQNYVRAVKDGEYFQLLFNSTAVCAVAILLIVLIGSLASYPLARRSEKGFNFIYLYFLSGLMIPFMAGVIPLYKLVKGIGLTDSIFSLVLISVGTCVPMSILIYTGFIKSVPRELEESVLVDGGGIVRTFFTIIFPLLKPATVSVIILNVLPIWNDFMTPLLFISSNTNRTLPLGMYNFMGEYVVEMGPVFAFGILVSILPIVLFLSLQKYFYKGIIAGAVKG